MPVPDEVDRSKCDERAFVNIEPQAAATRKGVADIHLCVAVLTIEQREEERRVIGARGRDSEFRERGNLLLELGAQFLAAERACAIDLHVRRLRDLVLFLCHLAFGAIFLFRSRNLDGGLGQSGSQEGGVAEGDQESAL